MTTNTIPADACIEITGVDEYGPRLNWYKHWVEFPIGTKFAPVSDGPSPAEAELRKEVDRLREALRDLLQQIESCDGTAQINTDDAEFALVSEQDDSSWVNDETMQRAHDSGDQ